MTIDIETKLLLEMTQKNIDDAIKRFERAYEVIIKDNKAKDTKLDLILAQQAEYAKNIALNKKDIERNKKDINSVGEKIEGMDEELEKAINKYGNLPLKFAAIIIVLITALGAINRLLPGTIIHKQSEINKN